MTKSFEYNYNNFILLKDYLPFLTNAAVTGISQSEIEQLVPRWKTEVDNYNIIHCTVAAVSFFSFFLGILLLSRKLITVGTTHQPPNNSYFMVAVTAYIAKLMETTWKSVLLVNLVATLIGNFLNKIYVLEKLFQYQTNSKWDQKLLWVLHYISIQAININFYLNYL